MFQGGMLCGRGEKSPTGALPRRGVSGLIANNITNFQADHKKKLHTPNIPGLDVVREWQEIMEFDCISPPPPASRARSPGLSRLTGSRPHPSAQRLPCLSTACVAVCYARNPLAYLLNV